MKKKHIWSIVCVDVNAVYGFLLLLSCSVSVGVIIFYITARLNFILHVKITFAHNTPTVGGWHRRHCDHPAVSQHRPFNCEIVIHYDAIFDLFIDACELRALFARL